MSTLKFGIIGSRNFTDKSLFLCKVNEVIALEGMPTVVISGGAIGADAMAQEWAIENTIEFQVFKPQHKDFPKNIRRFGTPCSKHINCRAFRCYHSFLGWTIYWHKRHY